MTRKRLKLAYIANDSLRKATFHKRKKGLIKKINELSVLCGIQACAVIHSPFSSIPDVWPTHEGVKNVVDKLEMLPEIEQEKKMMNHEGFLRQSVIKAMNNNHKKMAENGERTMKEAMLQLLGGNGYKLNLTDGNRQDLCKYIDQYLKELIHHKNDILSQSHLEYGESSSAATVMETRVIAEVGSSSFPNSDVFNPPQQTSDLGALRSIISLNQRPEHGNTFVGNFLPATNDQQGCYPMMNPVGVYVQNLHLNANNQYPQRFGNPNVGQDAIYNPNQNQVQHEEWLINQMMNHHEEMHFSMIDDNNRYYNQQL
ncbi:unnamed protein product [Arabis nemorensis]|uniref:MADS-box domain-containing protein n=1 Tax=Arabis nemorensis TaxID=586526 RepID=A0A565B4Q1_9BRAS|nr:unnamed protein product [Arabis nemorensis]